MPLFHPSPETRHLLRPLAAAPPLIGLLFLSWIAGFFWFVSEIPGARDHGPARTDAIVVLTGGSERLHEGLKLLREGWGKKLFVSGVAPGVGRRELLRLSGNAPSWALCCVDLGHQADNTRENAAETALWMKREGYRSLRLVTSWYHMPRSLLDFERAMPKITILAHPVYPAEFYRRRWWASERETLLLVGEYNKFLLALGERLVPREVLRARSGEDRSKGAARLEERR